MDPFELLKSDHKKVSELFERIESASGQAKVEIFKKIQRELEVHTHIEERIFYPALRNAEETRDITLEAYEEHRVVKDLLAELAAGEPNDRWDAKLTVLKENVEHHVDEEENDMFGKAKDVLSDEEAEALGDQMAAEKQKMGAPVEAEKPGIIKRVVKALFGSSTKKAGKKKAGTKKAASRAGTKKASGKSAQTAAAKRASKKKSAGKKKTATKKTASKAVKKAARKPAKKSATANRSAKKAGSKKSSR